MNLHQYADFLLRWQHAHPTTRLQGREGVLAVLGQLEGYGTYPFLWKRDILPPRIADFDPAWLFELIEDHSLVCGCFCLIGEPANAPGAGTVFCAPDSLAHLLVPHEPPAYSWGRYPDRRPAFEDCLVLHRAVLESGEASLEELTARTALDAEGVCRLIDAVADFLRHGGLYDTLQVGGVEGASAASDSLGEIFAQRGFDVDAPRWSVALADLEPWEGVFLPQLDPGGFSDASDDLIASVQAVFERVAGTAPKRQRCQGRTILKLRGRLVLNAPDGRDPLLTSTRIKRDQEDLLAAIPDAFREYARRRRDPYASHIEVVLSPDIDVGSPEFAELVALWVKAAGEHPANLSCSPA